MGRNLGPLNIKDSYEGLVQISGSNQLTDGSGSAITSLDVSASYATTASFALNVVPIDTGSFMVTGSVADATLTFTKGDASTFDLVVDNVANATSASNAVTAQTASFLPSDTNLNINSITASNASFQSASIGYLQQITGSAKIIGDAYIILNNDTPTERFAGLVVQDSGSTQNTASLEFDGLTNDWFYEYTDDGGATVDHGVAMFGPEYNTKGSPVYNTANTLVKGDGGHHLLDSSITDDGTLVTINADVKTSGSLTSGDGTNTVGTNNNEVAIGGNNNNVTGNRSAAIGGYTNTVSGNNSVMLGGRANTLSGAWSAVIGGQGATASGYTSATIAAETSTASNSYSFIAGAVGGIANQSYAVIVGGQNHRVTANSAGIFGGFDNDVSGTRSVAIGGTLADIDHARSVTLGGTSLATTKDDEVVVPHLTISGSTIATDISASGYVSASTFIGDGSQLSGISADAFPFTGSAEISGSLRVQSTTEGQIVTGHPDNIATGARAAVIGGGLAGADKNEATGTESAVIGGHNNVASNTHAIVAGGKDNTNSAFYGGIIAGRSTNLTGQYGIAAGGSYHGVSGAGGGAFAGYNHTVGGGNAAIAGGSTNNASGAGAFIGGGTINNTTANDSAIAGGRNSRIQGGERNFMGGGFDNLISSGDASFVVGGSSNTANGNYTGVVGGQGNNNIGRYSVIVGGTGHVIASSQDRNVLLGGQENDITSGDASGILAGYLNDIQATTAAVVGGRNNLSSHLNSVVIGGDGLSTTKDNEVVVPSLVANDITASFASFQSASIGYLQAITGSAKIIGDAYIILNNDTPTERYAGLVVQDSGSTANTASLEFDGLTNDWFYEYTDDGGATVDHGVALFGPEYNTKGSPSYPTNNVIQKGDGGHHLLDSSITDDGSKVTSTVPLADMVLSGSKTVISGSLDIVLPTDASDVNIINPDEKLALIVRGGIMAGSDESLSTDPGFNNHLFGERITAQSNTQTCGALGSREVDFGGNGIEYSAFIATQGATFDGGNRSAFIGGFNNTMDTEDSLGDSNVIITGQSNRIGAGERNVIAGGNDNTIVEGNNRAIIASKDSTLGYTSGQPEYSGSVILGGSGNSSEHNNTIFLGTTDITSDAHDTTYANNLHLTGSGATLTFNDGTTQTTAGGAAFPYTGSAEITGSLRVIGGLIAGDALNDGSGVNAMVLSQDSNGTGERSAVLGGYQGTASATDSVVIGGFSNQATALRGGVFVGQNNQSTHSRSVVVGGSGLSTSKADEVVVPSLSTNGAVVQNVEALTISANVAELDASLGNMFTLTLQNAQSTELQLINQSAGQTFSVQVTQNATNAGDMTFDSQFEFEDGTAFVPSSGLGAIDILTFTCFGGGNVQCVSAKNFS